uniref:Reverse transcriptase domain-containing protein n=1 Tax=Tanacetum cinerariifolium TaxID=118510 RepID=A0A6L2JHY5_TANCI|nr:reverse transcriptase domain-containing protein [Tanacetum cinerariifolium]
MSFPNHPTSNIEDAFSSNFPNYILASSDYVLASPGKTYSSSSNNPFGLVQIASSALSLFHDNPYMKVMHAYYAKELPIPSPVIMPPSLMLSPMFNSQEFFLPEEILPPKKRSVTDHTPLLVPYLKNLRYEKALSKSSKISKLITKQIRKVSWIVPPKRNLASAASTSKAPAMTQAAIRQLVIDGISTALEAQVANMANADNTNRNPKPRKAHVARKCSYKEFMSCQPFNFKGSKGAIGLIRWFEHTELVFSHSNYIENCKLLIKKYCPWTEIQKMEDEFYHLTMKGNDLKTYVRRIQELENLCPTMVSDSEKIMEAFIGGLPRSIKGNVTASKPQTLEEAINIAQRLMDQVTKHTLVQVSSEHKQKFNDRRTFNNYRNTNTNYRYNNHQPQQNRRQEAGRVYAAIPAENNRYAGNLPLCRRCVLHHTGPCTVKCNTCNKVGHVTKNYRNKGPATGSNLLPVTVTCHACGEKGHYANQCRKTNNNNAQGRAYMLKDMNAHLSL